MPVAKLQSYYRTDRYRFIGVRKGEGLWLRDYVKMGNCGNLFSASITFRNVWGFLRVRLKK